MNILIIILAIFGAACILLIIGAFIEQIIIIKRRNKVENIKKKQEKLKLIFIKMANDLNFIHNVCLSYRHDYGLLSVPEQKNLQKEYKFWLNAINNNIEFLTFIEV